MKDQCSQGEAKKDNRVREISEPTRQTYMMHAVTSNRNISHEHIQSRAVSTSGWPLASTSRPRPVDAQLILSVSVVLPDRVCVQGNGLPETVLRRYGMQVVQIPNKDALELTPIVAAVWLAFVNLMDDTLVI